MTGSWITQADRVRWQLRAVGALAAILAAHPDMPVIAWTVTASGRRPGRTGPRRPVGRGQPFALWQRALGLGEVTETPSAIGIPVYLHACGVLGGVTVSLAATVFDGEEDSR